MTYKSSSGALASKISRMVNLSPADRDQLSGLCTGVRTVRRQTVLREAGHDLDHLLCVEYGWLLSYVALPDGRRQVLQICLPGDLVGFSDIVSGDSSTDVRSLTAATVSLIPRTALRRLTDGHSNRMLAVLAGLSMQEQLASADRIRVLGRMNAREKLVHFLMCLYSRLDRIGAVRDNGFDFPLTQFDIADAIGLTNVSVSNMLSALHADGIIRRTNGYIEIIDFDYMRDTAHFIDRHARLDLSWLGDEARASA